MPSDDPKIPAETSTTDQDTATESSSPETKSKKVTKKATKAKTAAGAKSTAKKSQKTTTKAASTKKAATAKKTPAKKAKETTPKQTPPVEEKVVAKEVAVEATAKDTEKATPEPVAPPPVASTPKPKEEVKVETEVKKEAEVKEKDTRTPPKKANKLDIQQQSALVVGATGLVGSYLVKQLLHEPHYNKVIVLARKPTTLKHPNLTWLTVDFDKLDDYAENFKVNHVFSCLGSTRKEAGSTLNFRKIDHDYVLRCAELARDQGVERFIWVSSLGANPRSLFFYSRIKGELEESIAKLNLPFYRSVRPSLLQGPRQKNRLSETLFGLAVSPFTPLLRGPLHRLRPIHAGSVSWSMINIARDREVHEWLELWPKTSA